MEFKKMVIEHSTQEEHDAFIKRHPRTQLIIKDEDCLRLAVYFYVQLGLISFSFIQIKLENESLFNVATSIDGGIILYDKTQTDLFETSKING